MKVKVRKILLCVFFALFIVTLFTASFSLGRYSSVQSSESNYDDDFEYTLYDSIVVNTIDEFFAAISNGYNYIIIGDAIKDPLIIAGSMSDIRDDLIIDLNGHEIQRNSRDPLLNVTTGFTLTIIDKKGTGSMYNPVGSVIQVSGGTLTVQNGIFESGPRSDNSRDAKRHNDVNVNDYNEYVKDTPDDDELYSTPGGGSIRDTDTVTVYRNSNIGTGSTSNTYGDSIGTVALPIITPKATGRGVVNGSMYFDDAEEERIYYTCNEYNVIKDDTYLYYTFESDNMQYSEAADKSTANYYYQYYVEGGNLNADGSYPTDYFNYVGTKEQVDSNIRVTVYVFNDVKYYAAKQSGYTDSSGTPGFAAVKMQSGNLYVRGGTYYSYFGEENTFGVQSTGGLMSVNPTGSNAINFYAYQNGVCVECTVDKPTENEMLNISSGKFYSELGDTVRVQNGSLTIGTADFTKDVGSYSGETTTTWGRNGSVINISGGTLTINNSADFDITGSYINGIYSHGGANSSVSVTNATLNFDSRQAQYNCGIYAEDGNVSCYGNTTINLSNGASNNRGIYSAGNGYIAFGLSGDNVTTLQTTINVATVDTSLNNYGIYSEGGRIYGYGTTNITLGAKSCYSTNSQGIYSTGGTINLGEQNSQDEITITVYGNNSATGYSTGNFGIQTSSGTINAHGAIDIGVTGVSSSGILATTGSTINVYGVIDCTIDMASSDSVNRELSSPAVYVNGGNIVINSTATTEETHSTITSDGFGLVVNDGDITVTNGRIDVTTTRTTAVYLTGGKLDIAEAATMNVNSRINADCEWAMGDDASLQGANIYNGVYVRGGSLISNGTLNVEHVGVANDIGFDNINYKNGYVTIDDERVYSGQLHTQFDIKSYAVRVESATGSTSTVTINSGDITNYVGGGVYVSGGNVTLTNPNIHTYGNGIVDDYMTYFARQYVQANDNWAYRLTTTGGRALEVNGGTVSVYSGRYETAQGDALLVRGGIANIFGGTFIGNDNYQDRWNGPVCGPAASYAFKMYGGTANIYGGTFGDPTRRGSGAFIMGTDDSEDSDGWAKANIYNGEFVVSSGGSGGQAAISALEFATITFDTNLPDDISSDILENIPESRSITATGLAGGLVIEGYSYGNSYTAPGRLNIAINNGSFTSTRSGVTSYNDGIWYNNTNATLTINNGKFSGDRSGLTTERMPNEGKITINNGTFIGNKGINLTPTANVNVRYSDRVLINDGTFTGTNNTEQNHSAGLWLGTNNERSLTALTHTNIVHITGGTFTGYYGGYYGIDSADAGYPAVDGLLIEGVTFTGTQYGFYLADNPWSGTIANPTNNVAIIGGTFSGNSAAIQGVSYGIRVGDVFTTHTGDGRYGYCSNPYINGNAGAGSGGSINGITAKSFTLETRP